MTVRTLTPEEQLERFQKSQREAVVVAKRMVRDAERQLTYAVKVEEFYREVVYDGEAKAYRHPTTDALAPVEHGALPALYLLMSQPPTPDVP